MGEPETANPLRFRDDEPVGDPAAAERAFATWPDVYQKTVDGRVPIWTKRHG